MYCLISRMKKYWWVENQLAQLLILTQKPVCFTDQQERKVQRKPAASLMESINPLTTK